MFPAAQRMLYLDAARHTPLPVPVRKAVERFLAESEQEAGPKSRWVSLSHAVLERLAEFLGVGSEELVFTRNTSDGLNMAAQALPLSPGDNVVLFRGDHPNCAAAFLNLARQGVEVRFADRGRDQDDVASLAVVMDGRTRAVALSHVAFHDGRRADLGEIAALCAARSARLIVDAIQSVGILPIDLAASSLSAFGCNKGLLTPPGLGVLYVRRGQPDLRPASISGQSLEDLPADLVLDMDHMALRAGAGRFEIGIPNFPAIYGLDAALTLLEELGSENIAAHVLGLGDRLIERLKDLGVGLVGPGLRPQRSHIYVLDLPGAAWADHFLRHNARVSRERDGLRISFGIFNTADDVDRAADLLRQGLRERIATRPPPEAAGRHSHGP